MNSYLMAETIFYSTGIRVLFQEPTIVRFHFTGWDYCTFCSVDKCSMLLFAHHLNRQGRKQSVWLLSSRLFSISAFQSQDILWIWLQLISEWMNLEILIKILQCEHNILKRMWFPREKLRLGEKTGWKAIEMAQKWHRINVSCKKGNWKMDKNPWKRVSEQVGKRASLTFLG